MIASRRLRHVCSAVCILFARVHFAYAATTGVSVVAMQGSTRLTIPVMINGSGPYSFVLDTGSDRTVISRELAASLKLPAGSAVSLHDVAGTDTTATVLIDHLAFDHKEIKSVHAPVLTMAGLGAPGMLGLDGVRNEHVVMDFNAATVTIGPSRQPNEGSDANAIIVEGKRRFGQLVLVDAESHGEPILVILDSGAEETIGNTALRALVAEESTRTRRLQPTSIISVTGRKTAAEYDSMSEIRLGGITIRNVPIEIADLSIFRYLRIGDQPAMLLGMDVLRHFRSVSVDFRRGEALFVTR